MTLSSPPAPIQDFPIESLRVLVFDDRAAAGQAAAADVARILGEVLSSADVANVIFAAAPSQTEMLASLGATRGIDWPRVNAFHMDEYLGLDADHPASFRRYLNEHLFRLVGLTGDRLHLIPGEDADRPLRTCLAYEELLLASPPDLVCAGIGENGHLAFNDPPVADFLDPVLVKTVRLDAPCRAQQVNDGCFATMEDVPTHAYTLTVPALLRARRLVVVVPGPRKAEAVLNTLRGPYAESCPSTALRRHPGATLYLDRDSAKFIV